VDTNNRQLHPNEISRIKDLAKGDPEKQAKLTAAACALVRCADGVPTDDPAYVYLKGLQDAGASLKAEQALLANQKGWDGRVYGKLFQYTIGMDFQDYLDQTKQGTRVTGAVQAVGGVVGMAGGAAMCTTGVGCVGGAVLATVSADYGAAGLTQAITGNTQITNGELVLQSLGLSPQVAAITYALVGLSPAAVDALMVNRAVNAQVAANAWVRGTYNGTSTTSFTGNVYRYTLPEYSEGTWSIYPSNIAADHRYSPSGVGAVYAGTSSETANAEVASYSALEGKILVINNVKISNVLDLTDPAARQALGITVNDITNTNHGGDAYTTTQRIGAWARDQGYNAIIAPSAQNPSGAPNLISFKSLKSGG